jgi:uncharacterized protein YbaA (DUF1428 family)
MAYVDGFVVPVPEGNKAAYLDLATRAADVFRKHGALQVVEAWGDDVPDGKVTDFRLAVQAQDGEAVVFSWILWPSREARDAGHEKAMKELSATIEAGMPFDGKRMIFGGFSMLLDTAA